jgi:hypothetical protein
LFNFLFYSHLETWKFQGVIDDGMSKLIADWGMGHVLGKKMYEFLNKHLNRMVSLPHPAQFRWTMSGP